MVKFSKIVIIKKLLLILHFKKIAEHDEDLDLFDFGGFS